MLGCVEFHVQVHVAVSLCVAHSVFFYDLFHVLTSFSVRTSCIDILAVYRSNILFCQLPIYMYVAVLFLFW